MASARNKLLVLNAGSSSLKFKLFELLGPAAAGLPGATSGTSASSSKGGGASSSSSSGGSAPPDAREAAAATAGLHSVASGLCERIGDPAGGAVMKASRHPSAAGQLERWGSRRRMPAGSACAARLPMR